MHNLATLGGVDDRSHFRKRGYVAEWVAKFLAGHEKVEHVYYPGLEDHPHHELAKRQMRLFGGIVSSVMQPDAPSQLSYSTAQRTEK